MRSPNDVPLQRLSLVDLTRIESAHRILPTELHSDEARHAFRRRFDITQLNLHQLLVHGYNRLPQPVVAEAEQLVRVQLEKSTVALNEVTAHAERKLRSIGITELENYRPYPLVLPVKVFSSYGKRYLELICKCDLMMLILETMAIHGLISTVEMEQQKAWLKQQLQHVAYLVRDLRSASDESASALLKACSDRTAGRRTGPGRAGPSAPPFRTDVEPAT